MKFPEWFNNFYWWLILLCLFILLITYRICTNGLTTPLDFIIVLILFALLLMPLFEEIGIFGLRFKREIDSLRTDLTGQIVNLRSDFQTISMRMSQNQNINVYNSPPDQALPKIEENANDVFKKTSEKYGFQVPEKYPDPEVSKDIYYLFSTRYQIENEIRRLWSSFINDKKVKFQASRMLKDLTQNKIVDPGIADAISNVLGICNSAIHGEEVSERKVNFVKDLGPKLISFLQQYN